MSARGLLARAGLLCAAAALSACATSPARHAATIPASAAQIPTAPVQPEIVAASSALGEITQALSVNVRKINPTPRPTGKLAAARVQPRTVWISSRLQCVPFARERSGVAIRGNANTWWKQAAGSFVRVKEPVVGSVMVMNTRRGHVGVVTKIVDSRTVIIDHSNWLSNGQIYLDQPVMDVSPKNDWSQVVVWHPNLGKFGKRALTVSGFILDKPSRGDSTVYASLKDIPGMAGASVKYAAAPAVAPAATMAVAEAAPVLAPTARPAALTTPAAAPTLVAAAPAEAVVLPASPVYVDTVSPRAKPGALAAPVAVAAAAPASPAATTVYVDTITPAAKPGSLAAPMALASARPTGAAPILVDAVVPAAKPTVLGATSVAVVKRGDRGATNADATFIPTGKPASIATFR